MLSQFLASLTQFVTNIILTFSYPGIIFVTVVENIVTPIPSEIVFPWTGFLASQGKMNVLLISLSGAVGGLIGAIILYYIGYKLNSEKTKILVKNYGKYIFVKIEDLDKADEWFKKRGNLAIFVGRLIPIVRSLISLPAGYSKMNLFNFSFLTFLGTFIWSFVLTGLGYILGENWELVTKYLSKYEKLALASLIAVTVIFTYKHLRKNFKLR